MDQQQYHQPPQQQQYQQQNGGFRGGGRGGGRGRGRGGGGRGFGRGRGGGGRGGGGRGRGRGGFSHSYSHHQHQHNDQQQQQQQQQQPPFEDYGPQSHVTNHNASTSGDGYYQPPPPVPAAPVVQQQQQQLNNLPAFLNVAAYASGGQQHQQQQQPAYPPQSQYQQPQSGYGAPPVPSSGYGAQPAYTTSNPQFQQQQRQYDSGANASPVPPLPNQPPPPSEQGTESKFVPPLPKLPAPPLPASPVLAPQPPISYPHQQTQPQSSYSDALYSRQQAYAPVGTQHQQQPAPPLMPTPQPQYHAPQVQYQPQYQVLQQPPSLPHSYAQSNGYHHHPHYQQQQQQQYAQPAPVYAAPPPQQYQQQPVQPPQPPLPRSQPAPPQQQHQHFQQHPGSRPPPSTYCCHKCGQPGHWIQDCQSTQSNYNRGTGDRGQRPTSHGNSSYQQPAYYQQHQRPPQQDSHQVVHQSPPHPSTFQPAPPSYYNALQGSTDRLEQEDTHHVQGDESMEREQQHGQQRYGAPLSECPPVPDTQQQQQQWCCENCDKSFTMESQFDAHVKTHVACHAPNCDFSASKRVVGAHFQTAHGQFAGSGLKEIDVEGQKFMVLVGNSPEDIAQWRADRRKKWPSVAKRSDEPSPVPVVDNGPAPAKQQSKKRKLSNATMDSAEDLEDGEIDEEEPRVIGQASGQQQSEASQAVQAEPSAAVDDASEPSLKRQKRVWLCKNFLRNQCRFGDQCKFSHDRKDVPCRSMVQKGKCSKGDACLYSHDAQQIAEASAKVKTKNANKPAKGEKVLEEQWKTEQGSLLRKLLKKDMRVEQHRMLQIVRALVANQFFQQGAQPVVAQEDSTSGVTTVLSSSDAL